MRRRTERGAWFELELAIGACDAASFARNTEDRDCFVSHRVYRFRARRLRFPSQRFKRNRYEINTNRRIQISRVLRVNKQLIANTLRRQRKEKNVSSFHLRTIWKILKIIIFVSNICIYSLLSRYLDIYHKINNISRLRKITEFYLFW